MKDMQSVVWIPAKDIHYLFLSDLQLNGTVELGQEVNWEADSCIRQAYYLRAGR